MRRKNINSELVSKFIIPLFIFAIALCLRLYYLWELPQNPLFDVFPNSLDHFNFDQSAINFANGDLLARATNNSFAPLYKYFLGILYSLFGRNMHIVYFIQFCMGAVSCVLLYKIGQVFFGVWEGIFAALGLALYTTHIIYEGVILRASFISFLGVTSFYYLLLLKEKPRKGRLLWATLLLSLFFQARPNTLICLPLICVFFHKEVFLSLDRRQKSMYWRIFFGVLFTSFVPLLIQCYLVHGKFVFFDTSGPHTLISGNHVDYSGVGFDHKIIDNYRKNNLLSYGSNISFLVSHIFENTWGFFLLYIRKIYFFLNDFEAPTNISVYIYRNFSGLFPNLLNHYSLISSLALVGIVLSWRERKRVFLLLAFVLSISVAIVLFLNEARYRIPVVPFFILFAGKGLGEIVNAFNKKNYKNFAIMVIASMLIFKALSEPRGMDRFRANDYGNLGNAYIALKKWNLAEKAFKTSLEINPNNAYAHINLGRILANLNMREKAAVHFKNAIKLDPEQWQSYLNLGILFSHSGKWSEAESYLLKVWNISRFPEVAFHLGDLYGRMSLHKKAIKFLQEFLSHKPDRVGARFLLGVEYGMNGELEKSISAFRQTVEQAPDHSRAWNNLGTLYSRFGRRKDAEKAFQTAISIDPQFMVARENLKTIRKMLHKY